MNWEPWEPDDLERFLSGDRDSWNECLDGLYEPLRRWLARLVGNVDDAAELAQEVFLRAWARRDRFDPEKGRFSAWLMGIARMCIKERQRHRMVLLCDMLQGATFEIESEPQIPAHDNYCDAVCNTGLLNAASLSVLQLEVFVRRGGHGLSYEQIGDMIGCTRDEARAAYSHACDKVRAAWEEATGTDANEPEQAPHEKRAQSVH